MKFAAGLSTSQICSESTSDCVPLQGQQFIHMMPYIAKSLCRMFCCVLFLALFVVSLCDYQCHLPSRVVSSAAQAAAIVPPVRRHGEMLRLINRR